MVCLALVLLEKKAFLGREQQVLGHSRDSLGCRVQEAVMENMCLDSENMGSVMENMCLDPDNMEVVENMESVIENICLDPENMERVQERLIENMCIDLENMERVQENPRENTVQLPQARSKATGILIRYFVNLSGRPSALRRLSGGGSAGALGTLWRLREALRGYSWEFSICGGSGSVEVSGGSPWMLSVKALPSVGALCGCSAGALWGGSLARLSVEALRRLPVDPHTPQAS